MPKALPYRLEDMGHAVDVIGDGLAADEFLAGGIGDVVILDYNLPRMDGLLVLRAMRARGDSRPVLMLTARGETEDRVAGLDAGADDYLVKPFSMDELEARLRALLRRGAGRLRPVLRLGPLAFDLTARQVTIQGRMQTWPRREVSLLEALLGAEGRIVSKSDLLEHVYGTGADVEETAVEVHVSRLRKRLKPHGVTIAVQRGLGYLIKEA